MSRAASAVVTPSRWPVEAEASRLSQSVAEIEKEQKAFVAQTKLFERANVHQHRACEAGDYESCASLGGMSALKLRTPRGGVAASIARWSAASMPIRAG